MEISKKNNLWVIEDSAQSLGVCYYKMKSKIFQKSSQVPLGI